MQKKQNKTGWNGDALATVGTRDKYTAALSGNRQVGKFTFSGSADRLSNRFRGSSDLQQVATVDGRTTRTDQTGSSTRQQTNHSLRLGVDYAFRDEHRFSLTAQYYAQDFRTTQDFGTRLAQDRNPSFLLRNQNTQPENLYGSRFSGTYRRTFVRAKRKCLLRGVRSSTQLSAIASPLSTDVLGSLLMKSHRLPAL